MPRDECLITPRLAGPCATCRQPAWPAHVRGFEVYCEACCGCGRGDAEAPGRDAAGPACDLAARGRHQGQAHGMPPARSGPAHRMPRARAPGLAIALERGGKAGHYPARCARTWGRFWPCARHPARRSARRCPGLAAAPASGYRQHAARRPALAMLPPRACRPRGPRPGRLALAAMPPATMPPAWPAPQGRLAQTSLRRALRGETFPRQIVLAELHH